MKRFQKFLTAKVLFILLAAGGLAYIDTATDLKLGLDLSGGTQLDYKIDLSDVPEIDQLQIVEGVQEVIRRRVDSLGVSEPSIYSSSIADEHHIIVELAGISDIDEAKNTVGKTIQLEFREENPNPNDLEALEVAQTESQSFYIDLIAGGDFIELADAAEEKYESKISSSYEAELMSISSCSEDIQAAIKGKAIGAITNPAEVDAGYTVTGEGNITASRGMGVFQIVDKSSEVVETVVEEEVGANHI